MGLKKQTKMKFRFTVHRANGGNEYNVGRIINEHRTCQLFTAARRHQDERAILNDTKPTTTTIRLHNNNGNSDLNSFIPHKNIRQRKEGSVKS